MRRRSYLEPAVLVFVLALVLSLEFHFRLYGALGDLAASEEAAARRRPRASSASEVSFEIGTAAPATSPPKMAPRLRQPRAAEKKAIAAALPKTTPPPTPTPTPPPPPPETPPKPPPPESNRQAVRQRSRDPQVEPPPNARYLAKENQRVEEETAAKITNTERDDSQSELPREPKSQPLPEPGNAEEDLVAKSGGDDRKSERGASTAAPKSAPQPSSAAVARQASGARGAVGNAGAAATTATETLTVQDGMGTFVIRRSPPTVANAGRQTTTGALAAGGGGSGGAAGRRDGAANRLGLTWSQFESAVGKDQLQDERQAYAQRRRSRKRGGMSHQQLWTQFRSAIENYLPGVRPGNQTALNAAASPFADYLAAVHQNIHEEFADRFLVGLPVIGTDPLADQSLRTTLEVVLNRDGTVHRVGVVGTSGVMLFDHGAFSAVMRGQPYPQAPGSILSGDGRVYFHWGFYRNERQCGTFNAQPFILPNPPTDNSPGVTPQSKDKSGTG